MLYRGTPASIYRLRVGSIPYDTYLFPPGGKRGTTTQATLGGQNMQPALVPIALPADAAPGVREVSTPRGTFKFAVGEFPEYVEPAESGPHAVTVPVSINGRLAAAGEEDQYRFSLTKEQLGSYSFECFADRVGSPVVARLRLRDAKGQVIAASTDNGSRDPRLDVTLGRPGDYTLEVSDAAGKGGPECVYRVSAGTASPDFVVTVSPDNPNLGPGASLYLQVRVRRKVGITGDIQIRFRNLPPGVTASPTVIARDQTDGYVILTAAPDAKPGTFSAVTVEGVATVDGKQVVRPAAPHEVYRINNNAVDAERGTMVVTVGPEQGWRVSLQPESTSMGTNAPIKVKVKLDRRGMEGDLPFAIVGLPQSVQAPGSLLFKRGTSEMTFTMTPRAGGGPDPARRRRSLGGISEDGRFLIAVVNGREGEGMMMASPAVAITMKE
jgi:hypothetical protein